MTTIVMIFLGILSLGLGYMFMNIYNGLVSLRNQLERAWSNIDVLLKQRFDEIPQLVQTIEQYAQYEGGLLQSLAEARAHYGQAHTVDDKIKASQELSLAFKGILAIGEAYPELKANQNFIQLQTRVTQLESSLADRRETYNEVVANFNTRIEQFPDVFAARFLNYKRQVLFKATEQEKSQPTVKMNLPKFGKSA